MTELPPIPQLPHQGTMDILSPSTETGEGRVLLFWRLPRKWASRRRGLGPDQGREDLWASKWLVHRGACTCWGPYLSCPSPTLTRSSRFQQ